jgi:predicted Ser/Thr protein kinase
MDPLDELLLDWEERRDRGEPVSPETLCPDNPALAAELSRRIRLIQAFDDLACEISSPATACPEPPAPARVGKYEVRGLLGRGGMGVVYLGWDPALRREVAVKLIRSPLTSTARFEREGRALAQLKHPNIVGVYEAGTHAGRPYLAMEYVSGGSLTDHSERITAAGAHAVARLVERVARAVQYAHSEGVLHRDLKPANILLGPADEPLVADFGLAKLQDPETGPLSAPTDAETVNDNPTAALTDTTQPGTPAYMAPEQFDPALGAIGPAADIWALGVILYELTAGKRPFDGTELPTLARQVCTPPDFSVYRGRWNQRLAAVIARCFQVQPERRYHSTGELADALSRLTRSRRRWVWRGVAAAVLILAVAAPAVLVDWSEWRHQRDAATIQRNLQRDGIVQLVGPGVISSYRIREGEAGTYHRHTADGLRIQGNTDCSLLEFAALPSSRGYLIRLRLRIERPLNTRAALGAYVGHHHHAAADRAYHAFTFAGFVEQTAPMRETWGVLSQNCFSPPPPGSNLPVINHSVCIDTNTQSRKLAFDGPDRELAVTVRGTVVSVVLTPPAGGEAIAMPALGPYDRRVYQETMRDHYGVALSCEPGDPIPIGLFLRHCSCTVTGFEVHTLPLE